MMTAIIKKTKNTDIKILNNIKTLIPPKTIPPYKHQSIPYSLMLFLTL